MEHLQSWLAESGHRLIFKNKHQPHLSAMLYGGKHGEIKLEERRQLCIWQML